MANEYMVNSADLTSVANAIRSKSETTDYLVFPDGFVTAVQGIGGELNFKVVGGTTEPKNPKENMIWVNTNVEITEYAFNVEEPVDPIAGMVWIVTGQKSPTNFNVLKDSNINITIQYVKQYDGTAWINKSAAIYQENTWKDCWDLNVFKNGNQYEYITGGWNNTGYTLSNFNHSNTSQITIGNSLIAKAISSTSDYGGLIGTQTPVDISSCKIMRAKGNVTNYYSTTRLYVGISTTQSISNAPLAYIRLTANGDFDKTIELPADVEQVYIFVLAGCYTGNSTYFTCTLTVSEISFE